MTNNRDPACKYQSIMTDAQRRAVNRPSSGICDILFSLQKFSQASLHGEDPTGVSSTCRRPLFLLAFAPEEAAVFELAVFAVAVEVLSTASGDAKHFKRVHSVSVHSHESTTALASSKAVQKAFGFAFLDDEVVAVT